MLLASIFAVNRAAKRRRDAAEQRYLATNHGFSGHNRAEKEQLYQLKGLWEARRDFTTRYRGNVICPAAKTTPAHSTQSAARDSR